MHDQRNALFTLKLKGRRTLASARATCNRAAEVRLRARELHPVVLENLRRSAIARGRLFTAVASVDASRSKGDVAFDDARVVDDGLVLVVAVGRRRRVGIPRYALRPGTEVDVPGDRGRLVIPRELAPDQGLL